MPRLAPRAAAFAPLAITVSLLAGAASAQQPAATQTVEGELEVLIEDHPDGREVIRHFVRTASGRTELRYTRGKPAHLVGGGKVRVRGRRDAGNVLALDGAQDMQVLSTAPSATFGQQDTLVMLVNFQDDTSQAQTPASVESLVFGSINTHFQESSFGQAWLAGHVRGWYTLPMSKGTCDAYGLADLADSAAKSDGVNLSAYRRKVYIFPRNACGWAGLGNVGGTTTRAWSNGYYSSLVIGHELGHNFGLHHAQALNCDTGATTGSCTTLTYGDTADMMGNYRAAHFSPFAKERLGWLNDGTSPPILTATANGRYRIEPYSGASVGAKAVKIPRGTDGSGRRLWYYVEYRQPLGADSVLANTGNLTKGVVVRMATEGDATSSRQLDMTPGTSTNTYTELADGALGVGLTFSDGVAGVSISLAAADTAGATIDVSFGGATASCVRGAPLVSLTGPATAHAAGSSVGYTLSVANRDSAACSPTSFNLASSVPAGWSGALSASSMTLSAGSSGSATLAVTSPASASGGTYGIGAGTASSAGAVHTANGSATYQVATQDAGYATLSAAVGTDKSSYARGDTVYLSALVQGDGAPVAGVAVQFTLTQPNGGTTALSATSGADGHARATYKIGKAKGLAGQWAVRAQASASGKSAQSSAGFAVK